MVKTNPKTNPNKMKIFLYKDDCSKMTHTIVYVDHSQINYKGFEIKEKNHESNETL